MQPRLFRLRLLELAAEYEAQHAAAARSPRPSAFAFAEVVLRIGVLGIMNPRDRLWNLFDIAILLPALAEVALDIVVRAFFGKDRNLFENGGMARMLRLFRLTRLLRIIRTIRQLKPLRVLVHSIISAGKSVFWALTLLVMIVFAFGVILTQAVSEHTVGGTQIADSDLIKYYGAQLREKQVYADRLRMLFEEMNADYDAECEGLTAADIYEQMEKPKVQSWFKAMDIDAKQTWKLFKALDTANAGIISLQDFVEGCLQMKGSATRVDVESLKWEIRAANQRAERNVG
ncbi:unnamed protein product [Prorocentrum cordatum]|uniref:EF-hand domain-containing protein n=1 Tax=Prorocentrum cordatum TaxID=2364126 RepID=A0ABN9VSL8_9DINO|nr:unnamed protein product [Polarella glacialis]